MSTDPVVDPPRPSTSQSVSPSPVNNHGTPKCTFTTLAALLHNWRPTDPINHAHHVATIVPGWPELVWADADGHDNLGGPIPDIAHQCIEILNDLAMEKNRKRNPRNHHFPRSAARAQPTGLPENPPAGPGLYPPTYLNRDVQQRTGNFATNVQSFYPGTSYFLNGHLGQRSGMITPAQQSYYPGTSPYGSGSLLQPSGIPTTSSPAERNLHSRTFPSGHMQQHSGNPSATSFTPGESFIANGHLGQSFGSPGMNTPAQQSYNPGTSGSGILLQPRGIPTTSSPLERNLHSRTFPSGHMQQHSGNPTTTVTSFPPGASPFANGHLAQSSGNLTTSTPTVTSSTYDHFAERFGNTAPKTTAEPSLRPGTSSGHSQLRNIAKTAQGELRHCPANGHAPQRTENPAMTAHFVQRLGRPGTDTPTPQSFHAGTSPNANGHLLQRGGNLAAPLPQRFYPETLPIGNGHSAQRIQTPATTAPAERRLHVGTSPNGHLLQRSGHLTKTAPLTQRFHQGTSQHGNFLAKSVNPTPTQQQFNRGTSPLANIRPGTPTHAPVANLGQRLRHVLLPALLKRKSTQIQAKTHQDEETINVIDLEDESDKENQPVLHKKFRRDKAQQDGQRLFRPFEL